MGSVEKPTNDSEMESTEEEDQVKTVAKTGGVNAFEPKQDVMASLPPIIRRRIHALKNLQLSVTNLDAKFYMEVHALEVKYMRLYYPFLDKRAEIVNGRYEPNEKECEWDSESEDAITEGMEQAKIEDKKEPAMKEDVKGIPGFWLTIFKNVSMLADMVQEHDEPILEHLEDIKVIMLENDPMGFVLEFHFGPNEYFTNSVLTKEYNMKCQPDPEHPFDFEGPEIYKCIGCPIMWCKDKNVTVKTVKKRQKHKSRGSVRTVVKTIPTDSFFNFFDPPELPSDPASDADDIQNLLTSDFEIGHYMRERVVPFAVLLYTGEGLDEEEDFEEEEDEEECSSEEESSAAEENTVKKGGPAVRKRVTGGNRPGGRGPRHPSTNDESNEDEPKPNRRNAGKGGKGNSQQNQPNPAECKQQ